MHEKVLLVKSKLNDYILSSIKLKKYIFIYFLTLVFFTINFFSGENYINPIGELIFLLLIFLLGTFSIVYSSKKTKELHNIAFVIILIFGVLSVFISPILIVCDENEHFARSEMTSSGVLIPEHVEGKGFEVSTLFDQLNNQRGETFISGEFTNDKIKSDTSFYASGFPQNPFYGYLPQAFGIFIAKLLDLSIIWAMWLGRFFNLLLYAIIIRFAIKKTPSFKIPLLIVACLPLAIYQAASFSIDPFINGIGILSIAYFIYMYKSPSEIEKKDLLIFFTLILSIGLIKIPYILLSLLIFLVPKKKFSKETFIISRIILFVIIIISTLYTYGFASNQLLNTERNVFFIENNVSASGQVNYILNNPFNALIIFLQLGNSIPIMINNLFIFSHMEWIYASRLLSLLYVVFFGAISLFYPKNIDFTNKSKIKIAIIFLMIYVGTFIIQYLTWTPVGASEIEGVFTRYFIPLLCLIPLIINVNHEKIKNRIKIDNLDFKIILIVIIFLAATLILTIAKFY